MSTVLTVNNLTVKVTEKKQMKTLVADMSFTVAAGQCLGILGESGSGKSMTCKAITGLLDRSFHSDGEAIFSGSNLIGMEPNVLRKIRGKDICMILQNPMTSFDPLCRIGAQMAEGMAAHTELSKVSIKERCFSILDRMQIRNPEEVLLKYPHQLSGGMLQRIMIGMALVMEPKLLIADEPTTALDSITQYSVVEEFKKIKENNRVGMIFISHDLGVLSQIADDVIVMHNAKIMQRGKTKAVMTNPGDEYTKFLLAKKKAVMQKFYQVLNPGNEVSVCS